MPMLRRCGGSEEPPFASSHRWPLNVISPASALSRPAMMRRAVVFPQPDGPRSEKVSPRSSSSERSCKRGCLPKDFLRPFSDRDDVATGSLSVLRADAETEIAREDRDADGQHEHDYADDGCGFKPSFDHEFELHQRERAIVAAGQQRDVADVPRRGDKAHHGDNRDRVDRKRNHDAPDGAEPRMARYPRGALDIVA